MIVSAVILSGGCSETKTVREEKPQQAPGTSEKVTEPALPVPKEGPEAEVQKKEQPTPEAPEEMTISIPEQDSKIEIVIPENKEAPAIDTGEAKKDAVNILGTINRLEETYEQNDFEGWRSMLTPAYREKYSDPENLHREGWEAEDLRSFFNLLVETRRKGNIKALKISRVEFVNPDKAYVYVFFENREFPEPQHTFIRINGTWLKGLREEE